MEDEFCKFNLLNLQNRHLSIFQECEVLITNKKPVQKNTLVNVIHKSRVSPAVSDVRQNAQKGDEDFDPAQFVQNFWEKFGIVQIYQNST